MGANEYYQKCALPKPASKKKRKKQNGWKDKPQRYCAYTGMAGAERHELFEGNKNRQISIDYGFQIDLCWPIHKLFHGQVDKAALKALGVPGMFPNPGAWAEKELKRLRRNQQNMFELKAQVEHDITREAARARWMDLIGRNYID